MCTTCGLQIWIKYRLFSHLLTTTMCNQGWGCFSVKDRTETVEQRHAFQLQQCWAETEIAQGKKVLKYNKDSLWPRAVWCKWTCHLILCAPKPAVFGQSCIVLGPKDVTMHVENKIPYPNPPSALQFNIFFWVSLYPFWYLMPCPPEPT